MIVILTGAKKNIGDYLIKQRARELLEKYVDQEIVEISRFENLESKLDIVNNAKALILCGGPAYASDFYPGIYPLVDQLDKIKVPIIPFGLGWSGRPYNHPEKFKFTPQSLSAIKKIHSKIRFSSCRDEITKSILNQAGIKNVILTGCPVWYDLNSLNKEFNKPENIKNIVVTSGAKIILFFQTLKILSLVRKAFPEAVIYFTFHRGILPWKGTSLKSGIVYVLLALLSHLYKVKVMDVSSNINKISFYANCDMHIGYRVHAHLYFLSKRIPSILINEDGRGIGMAQTLELPVLNYNNRYLIRNLKETLNGYLKSNFSDFNNTQKIIDEKFKTMRAFLSELNYN
jgi:polysaccharide pyruvyl transferase WcaK-like protein